MNRRLGWVIGSAAVALVLIGVAVWIWQSSGTPTSPGPTSPAATVAPTPEADARADAQAQLDGHLERCAEEEPVDGTVPEGCGIRIPWGTEFAAVDSIRFRIDELPVLALSDDGTFMAEDGILVATVSGVGHDGSPRTETYRTETWTVRGDAQVTKTGVELTVW